MEAMPEAPKAPKAIHKSPKKNRHPLASQIGSQNFKAHIQPTNKKQANIVEPKDRKTIPHPRSSHFPHQTSQCLTSNILLLPSLVLDQTSHLPLPASNNPFSHLISHFSHLPCWTGGIRVVITISLQDTAEYLLHKINECLVAYHGMRTI